MAFDFRKLNVVSQKGSTIFTYISDDNINTLNYFKSGWNNFNANDIITHYNLSTKLIVNYRVVNSDFQGVLLEALENASTTAWGSIVGNIDNQQDLVEKINSAVLAKQTWLPAVATKNDLPSVQDIAVNYLCRVINDPDVTNNGVYQHIENTPSDEWHYFSDNLDFIDESELQEGLSLKQDVLVSGQNIKTINDESLLGDGDLSLPPPVWGGISGTLSNQSDLNTSLTTLQTNINNKQDKLTSVGNTNLMVAPTAAGGQPTLKPFTDFVSSTITTGNLTFAANWSGTCKYAIQGKVVYIVGNCKCSSSVSLIGTIATIPDAIKTSLYPTTICYASTSQSGSVQISGANLIKYGTLTANNTIDFSICYMIV
jgi:hypothetical protein